MEFSLATRTVTLSVGEFASFSLGPQESGGAPQGLWRAQLGQHWHNELRLRALADAPHALFEIVISGRVVHRGWTFVLGGRIDQQIGTTLREIKSVTRSLPADEAELRADYPSYFLQLAMYATLQRLLGPKSERAELVFVEAGSGLSQNVALTPFDEALVFHQLDALVEFLNLRQRAADRRQRLEFKPAFAALRDGQQNIQAELATALDASRFVLFEAPTGYGKTGCLLEFALGQMRAGRFERILWLTGKSTGQLQVVHTLEQMTAGSPLAFWQVRNKSEHCINHSFHCVRDNCTYLDGCSERWPQSGLSKFYLDDTLSHDLGTLRTAGRDARICPYEITRAALAFNDVWIGDFNYVFAPSNRSLFFDQPGFDPAKTLLIIDEAHNLPSRVAGAYSNRASDGEARLLLAELDYIRAPAVLQLAVEEWVMLLASFSPADSLDPMQEEDVRELVARLARLVANTPLDYAALGPRHSESLWQFAALADFLAEPKLTKLLWVSRVGELEFTCVDAAPAIGETLALFGGAMLMSATLQPYREFATACGLDERTPEVRPSARAGEELAQSPSRYVTLSALTPWRTAAYDVAVDLRVDTTFRQRANYYGTTAATIGALHRAAGGAVAVFFPSYAYAESILRALDNSGSALRVAVQPRSSDLATQTAWVEESLVFSDVLFLVLGSSFAEGIDLLGGRVTHAMVVGPALPEVNAVQKARTDTLSSLGREAAFRRVYQIPGLQKVNQALGRLVRAPGQKAKVVLHCRRFADSSYAALLATDYQFFRELFTEADLFNWLELE